MFTISASLLERVAARSEDLKKQNIPETKEVCFDGCNGRSDGSYRCGGGK